MVSTGISLPTAFWDNNTKQAKKPWTHINDEVEAFKAYCQTLYNNLIDSKVEITEQSIKEAIKSYIVKELKQIKKGREVKEVVLPGHFTQDHKGIPVLLSDYITYKIDQLTNQGYYQSKKGDSTLTGYKRFKSLVLVYESSTNIF